jgi:hypothetical protein
MISSNTFRTFADLQQAQALRPMKEMQLFELNVLRLAWSRSTMRRATMESDVLSQPGYNRGQYSEI